MVAKKSKGVVYMSKLHDKMLQDMQLRGFSPSTQRTYLNNLQRFESFFQKTR
jgi:hypothetical protein